MCNKFGFHDGVLNRLTSMKARPQLSLRCAMLLSIFWTMDAASMLVPQLAACVCIQTA